MNKTKNAESKGITLIALIITIIIMLILVTVSITMAVKGGLFKYASDAVKGTKNAKEEEEKLAKGMIEIDGVVYDSLDMYLKGIPSGTELFSEIKEENYEYTDKNNKTVTIPAGFAVGTSEGINTVAGGLVITDKVDEKGKSIGNEFVWIPVKDGEFERTSWLEGLTGDEFIQKVNNGDYTNEELKHILLNQLALSYSDCTIEQWLENENTEETLFEDAEIDGDNPEEIKEAVLEKAINNYYNCHNKEGFIENLANDPTGEYANMVASVNKYGGFYIGRYEAGSDTPRSYKSNGTTTMSVKKGKFPYNYVGWGPEMNAYEGTITSGGNDQGYGAVYLSKDLYDGAGKGVVSTLCYGVQWDSALRFIKDKVNVTDSTNWGNHYNSSFKFTGGYSTDNGVTWDDATNKDKPERTNYLLTTGASDRNKAKNIYDLAGNVWEWTMDKYEESGCSYRVGRGGYYDGYGYIESCAYCFYNDPVSCSSGVGFRPALYIVELDAE